MPESINCESGNPAERVETIEHFTSVSTSETALVSSGLVDRVGIPGITCTHENTGESEELAPIKGFCL